MKFISALGIASFAALQVFPVLASAETIFDAPGAPGIIGTWSRPDKTGFGTTRERPLWFTTLNGVLTEVFYPNVDRVQTKESFLLIRGPHRVLDERKDFTATESRYPQSLAFAAKLSADGVKIGKRITVDPNKDAILIDYAVEFEKPGHYELIFIHNPAAEGTPGGDGILVEADPRGEPVLVNFQADVRGDEPEAMKPFHRHFVAWSLPHSYATAGFEGSSAPEDQINRGTWPRLFNRAMAGNVAGALAHATDENRLVFRVILSFTRDFQDLLKSDFTAALSAQQKQWQDYLAKLNYPKSDPVAEASILVLKACEDKQFKGAFIAAPAMPALPASAAATEQNYEDSRRRVGDSNGGYHRVWPRDLYHQAMALLAMGDTETPVHIARWLQSVQHGSGKWWQNMWVNGDPSWQSMQLDQVAYPIILVARLAEAKIAPADEFRDMINKAARFILQNGPSTQQERWEENGGLSPNSLAAAVQGLRAAAWLEGNAEYAHKADEWSSRLKEWTLIPEGALGSNYIARLEVGSDGKWDPSHHNKIHIQNKPEGAQADFGEDEILDGGFLQWIFAGLINPKDGDFINTMKLYDRLVRKKTSAGVGYLRYNEDSYGENYKGGAWPLLSAERGLAAIEQGEPADQYLDYMIRSSTSTGMIGEQDTVAARPLAWSHAAYLILRRSMKDGRSFYIPKSF